MGNYGAIEASWDLWERCEDTLLEMMGWERVAAKPFYHPEGFRRSDVFLPRPEDSDLARVARLALEEGRVPPKPANRYHFIRGRRGQAEEVLTEEAKNFDIASAYAPFHGEYKKFMEAKESA